MKSAPKSRLNSNFVEALYSVGVTAGLSDGQLLDQFLAGRNGVNEVAFAALMERHGPMVFQVCSKVLGNSHDGADQRNGVSFDPQDGSAVGGFQGAT
jgi:hypothetical protein